MELGIINGAELVELGITEIPTLVDPVLPKVGLISLIGTSDIGKSTLLLQLCKDITLNDTFLGFPLNLKHKSSIYVSTEDDPYSLSYRLQNLNGQPQEKIENMRFLFEGSNLLHNLNKALNQQGADVIIIDTFSDIYPGEMNQVNKVRSFMNDFYELALIHQCLVIFNHHTGKYTEEKPPSKNNSIGSAGFEGKCRVVMELRQDYDYITKRQLCIVKGNYLSAEYKTSSFELDFDQAEGFKRTGIRRPFDELAKPVVIKDNGRKKIIENMVINLHSGDRTCREIERIMKEKGFSISKSRVAQIIKECCPSTKSFRESLDMDK